MRISCLAHSVNSTVLTKGWAAKVSAFIRNDLRVIAVEICTQQQYGK